MRVLVDTSVWSLALRRQAPTAEAEQLASLIRDGLVSIIGPIRQEVLSGISDKAVFERLVARLDAFEDTVIAPEDYITAAEFYNTCRQHGIQGSHIDFLICAVAAGNGLAIFTTDKDFTRYAAHVPIQLYSGT